MDNPVGVREDTETLSDGARLWMAAARVPDRPWLVLLHGGPGMWDNLAPVADGVGDLVSTLRYDQRGCGRSGPDDRISLARYVADLDELRAHVGASSWAVYGHSFGAALALEYAAVHPARVDRLVLSNGTGLDWPEFRLAYHRAADARRTPAQQQRLAELSVRERSWEEEVEWRTLSWLPDFADPAAAPGLAAQDASTPLPLRREVNAALNAETNGADPAAARERCSRVRSPTLVVHGELDPRPLGGVARLAAALPDAELVVLPGCAHQPWREDPAAYRALLRAFLGGSGGTAGGVGRVPPA